MTRRGWAVLAGLGGVAALAWATSRPALPGGRVQVFVTSQVGGALAPCGCSAGQHGGTPRRAAAIARERLSGGATLVLDAGNFVGQRVPLQQIGFADPYPYHELHNLALARGMRAMGFDAVNVGERDFLLGQAFLHRLRTEEGLPLVSANIVFAAPGIGADGKAERRRMFPPYVVRVVGQGRILGIPYGGVKVGIFGLAREWSKLQYRPPEHGADPNPLTWAPVAEALREVATTLREREGCALVIGLTQLKAEEARTYGQQIPGIDLLVAGGEYKGTDQPRRGGQTVVVASEFEGRAVGEVILRLKAGEPVEVERWREIRLDDAVDLWTDPAAVAARAVQAEVIRGFRRALEQGRVAPDRVLPTEGTYLGSAACAGCHAEDFAHWEAQTSHGSLANFQKHIVDQEEGWNPACLRCHVTGYAYAGGFRDLGSNTPADERRGVGCESCHGPRSAHVAWERWKGGDRPAGVPPPPEVARAPEVRAPTCMACHDKENSPKFDFWGYAEKIEHPVVKRKREARQAEQDRRLREAGGGGVPPGGGDPVKPG